MVYLREDEYDDADSKADDDQTEKIIFFKISVLCRVR